MRKVYVLYYKNKPNYQLSVDHEYLEYSDIIMYKYFYRLLGEIDNDCLIVVDEIMRTQNRSDLTYNCAHHYLNQTEHKIIFEYFPIIETVDDFMILLDFKNKDKYKGKSFNYDYLTEEDVVMRPIELQLIVYNVDISDKDRTRYERKKDSLFKNLGMKDPDTIPRNLQLFAGDLKKPSIHPNKIYVARNKRFNLDNVFSYNDITHKQDYIVLDTHYRRLNFNDFLKTTCMHSIPYISTGLSIDNYIVDDFNKWKGRLEDIYAKANLR
ncbi:MAG: hypothetical protein PHN69_06775 [Candidatus Pacebacteria bacterium]|nr:hypothetical protein [Candidatus Paceibacterota bacterium]